MALARKPKGLTEEHVSTLREALTANRRPRVALQGNQFGEDARGQVVAVGDPAVDGDEFISVRVKLAGISDTLTFSPEELTLPGRGKSAGPAGTAASRNRRTAGRKSAVRPAAEPRTAAPPLPQSGSTDGIPIGPAPGPATRRAPGKGRAAAAVTVTVSSSGHSWTLSATRGGRSLLRATPVPAGVVTAVSGLFGDAALCAAVADINQVALAEAEERAEILRKELAAIESILQSHRLLGS
ncbi:MAG: hypothetical protein M3Z00_11765 [Actinomycetota bacterium]|nr:hypothetical protein [Actinomycetota bacterium]